ncbi:hypothetical protein RhiirA1_469461 [Rhizophagus irregularis]|uniref:Transposase domain-containing protein n=1 Tax=Rhizophagus irregularis TaxID=588596 RepID=A0A2N0R7Z7_9GLOM|nr:hypothetical protein RhiirA1_469461 [Rhizophagus irregularis]
MIYATTSLWKHLPSKDQKILTHFIRVYSILVSRILEIELMEEAYERLIKIIKLIEVHYERVKITPNLHLLLHLYDCLNDFGLLYAYWCFSFKRMNGILNSLPTSNRQIELEIMRQIMNNNQIRDIISSDIQTKDEEQFWLNAKNIQKSTITGCEPFPGEMLKLSSKAIMTELMLELMVAFYNASYIETCQIGSEVFGFAMSIRHTKSSYVLAKFITSDEKVDSYPRQNQYFFKYTVDLPNGQMEHNLAYIQEPAIAIYSEKNTINPTGTYKYQIRTDFSLLHEIRHTQAFLKTAKQNLSFKAKYNQGFSYVKKAIELAFKIGCEDKLNGMLQR